MENTTNFIMKPKVDFCFKEFYSCFHMWEDKRRRKYSDKFEIHIVELPKLAEHEYPETALLKWAKFLNAEKKEEFEMAAKTDPHIRKAYEQLLYMSEDGKKRLIYEARQKAIYDYNTQVYSNWHSGYEQGEKNGISIGEKNGISIGEEKKLIEHGYESLEEFSADRRHADKWLGRERIAELEEMRLKKEKEKKEQPVQLSLFDMEAS